MCDHIIQSSPLICLAIIEGLEGDGSRFRDCPAQSSHWGSCSVWCKDPKGYCKLINAKCETVQRLPTFRNGSSQAPMQTDGLAPFRSSRLRKNRVFTVIFLMRAA